MSMRKLRIRALRLSFFILVPLALLICPPWIGGTNSILGYSIELVGYAFLLAGLAVRIWCTFYIGGRKSKQLITQGPYSISRNPLYIGTCLLVIGVGLCFQNPAMLAFSLAIILPAHFFVIRMEETHLEKLFGEEFLAYKRRVPRYWPRLSGYESPANVTVPVRAIRRIAIDTAAILILPEIEDLLEILHSHGLLPVLWHWQCWL